MKTSSRQLSIALKEFLTEQMPRLRGMSPNTVKSYRDCMVLLLRYLNKKKKKPVEKLSIEDLDPKGIIQFLDYLERERNNRSSTRNVRLAAIHAFFQFVAGRHPEKIHHCQTVLAIPFKRSRSRTTDYFEYTELESVVSAIDRASFDGRRDYALLSTMFNTGARVQEILDIRAKDLQLAKPGFIRLFGKGSKERLCPIWSQTADLLEALLLEQRIEKQSHDKVFRNHRGHPLTRFGIRYILKKYCGKAAGKSSVLAKKRLHPHSMRHSTAIHLLKAGVDIVTISQWLGHACATTTNRYASLDLDMKRDAISKIAPTRTDPSVAQWKADASILEWLEGL